MHARIHFPFSQRRPANARSWLAFCAAVPLLITLAAGTATAAATPSATPAGDPTPPNPGATSPAKLTDPLEAAARSLKPTQVRVEPATAAPAGDKNETAEYEWAVLGRVAASEIVWATGARFTPAP